MNDFIRALVTMSVIGAIVALVLFVLKPFIKNRLSKTYQYYIWLVVVALLLVPVSLELPAPSTPANSLRDVAEAPLTVRETVDRYVVTTNELIGRAYAAGTAPSQQVVMDAKQNSPFSFVFYVGVILWPAGIAVFLLWIMATYLRFVRRIKKRSIPASDEETAMLRAMYPKRALKLLKSPDVPTPMLIGLFRPAILLPDKEYDGTQLKNILLHELTHLRRMDIAVKWLVTLVNAVHWFNPIIYFVRREMNKACELSCDEAVIKTLGVSDKQSYGDTLISVTAESCYPAEVLSTTMCEDKKTLKERLVAIMKYKKSTRAALITSAVLALIIAVSGIAMGASFVSNQTYIAMPDSALSAMSPEALEREILRISGSKSESIYITDNTWSLNMTADFSWASPSTLNMMEIYIPAGANDAGPYTIYQLHFDADEGRYWLVKTASVRELNKRWHFTDVLNALKYLPTEQIAKLMDTPPSRYMIEFRTVDTHENTARRLFYDNTGLTQSDGWLVGLNILPMYEAEQGGFHGLGEDAIGVYYAGMEHGTPDNSQRSDFINPNATDDYDISLAELRKLAEKGVALTEKDLAGFSGQEIGSGLYIMRYKVEGGLTLTATMNDGMVISATLASLFRDNAISLLTDDIEAFLEKQKADMTEPRFNVTYSPDGKYLIEGYGLWPDQISGITPAAEIRMINIENGEIVWSMSPGYLERNFIWSSDSRYASVYYMARIYGEALVVDTLDMSEHLLPGLNELTPFFPDAAPNPDRPDPYIRPRYWLDDHTIFVEFQWTKQDDEAFWGRYTYDVSAGEIVNVREGAIDLPPEQTLSLDLNGDGISDTAEVFYRHLGPFINWTESPDSKNDEQERYPFLRVNTGGKAYEQLITYDHVYGINVHAFKIDGNRQALAVALDTGGTGAGNMSLSIIGFDNTLQSLAVPQQQNGLYGFPAVVEFQDGFKASVSCPETGYIGEVVFGDIYNGTGLYDAGGKLLQPGYMGEIDGICKVRITTVDGSECVEIYQYLWGYTHTGGMGYLVTDLMWSGANYAVIAQRCETEQP